MEMDCVVSAKVVNGDPQIPFRSRVGWVGVATGLHSNTMVGSSNNKLPLKKKTGPRHLQELYLDLHVGI
jgi:hypothetical protein